MGYGWELCFFGATVVIGSKKCSSFVRKVEKRYATSALSGCRPSTTFHCFLDLRYKNFSMHYYIQARMYCDLENLAF